MARLKENLIANLEKESELQDLIKGFYKVNFEDRVKGNRIENQLVG